MRYTNHPERLVLYTLIVDGKKLSVGTSSAFKHFRDFKGITLQLATNEDIETLEIHPGTPARFRKRINEFLDSRRQIRVTRPSETIR
ncbi:hypothetical protein [Desulfofustis glycolicus]|uniref:Uncharacterized protein n=1 Tax=Desulfofustis glycolicus DSM 9705 TaxID=1121409 RepID=A0A1M5SF96_9BACT|nr:hypothetical protein [Desulfofustis glycolicus]MCB2216114.1 hypothetical protein [Desulfobulbaceae bacterium]SHH37196.1 hypothetical protein SAMN02745124_00320 [Desulfofustis glycolicus DSM 9705]